MDNDVRVKAEENADGLEEEKLSIGLRNYSYADRNKFDMREEKRNIMIRKVNICNPIAAICNLPICR